MRWLACIVTFNVGEPGRAVLLTYATMTLHVVTT